MADPVIYGNPERDIGLALVTLKKGTQLLKFSRKGKPKLRQFRISPDETSLIWYSHGEERNLKFCAVSKIVPGQRTAVFRRHPRPEKDYLSFSLLYNNCERSLDLICKDKIETEVWFTGLKALISSNQHSRRTKSEIPDFYDGGDFLQNCRPSNAALEAITSLPRNTKSSGFYTREPPNSTSSDAASDRANMQGRTSNGDGFRLSVSSAPSSSSQGSGPDDIESLGDVYVWGEVWSDGTLNSFPSKVDALLPKPLESNVVLDVHQIACGVRHAALVTRQGEVFTWGEESGGRLGHGIDKDFSRPQLVEFLAVSNVDCVSCGEFHTCAVSMTGDLFTWGDGNHNAGLLGHGTDVSHWIPKRVSSPLEGIQVLSVACGTWHTALVTSNGKLFTFGDGSFGVLGHGNRESASYPIEVKSLSGLKTIQVACGVWHSAAIVEVMGQPGAKIISRKLFTWGDGDKNRLGHGDKETRLVPTCVSTLIDYDFQQLACGHNITVALTTSGHVFTMGSSAHGQLGNPLSDGKIPCLVQDKLVGEFVEQISCGSFHVAVLTSRSEVYTWGKGANGRLGHGDIEDRKAPTLVEALKDRHVKNISCGSNFTASICIHKWVSGADQSVCSGCRQTFGFTRKRHNCYNCGLVHCHACSSKKAVRAALAPTPGKPHRVCDSCYAKLKASEGGSSHTYNINSTAARRSIDSRIDRGDVRSSKTLLPSSTEPLNKQGMVSDSRFSQVPSLFQLKDISFPSSLGSLQLSAKSPVPTSPLSSMTSRPTSPYSRKSSPPHSTTPVFSKSLIDSLKKTNEVLNQEVQKLQSQVKSLRQKTEIQDAELQKLQSIAEQATSVAVEQSSKCMIAKDVIMSCAAKWKDFSENLSPEVSGDENFKAIHSQIEALLKASISESSEVYPLQTDISEPDHQSMLDEPLVLNGSSNITQDQSVADSGDDIGAADLSQNSEENRVSTLDGRKTASHESTENASRSPRSSLVKNEGSDLTEQFEPGVYITFFQLQNGRKVFRRVRFSKKRYSGQQAEEWWKENKDRVFRRYKYPNIESPAGSSLSAATPTSEEADVVSSS